MPDFVFDKDAIRDGLNSTRHFYGIPVATIRLAPNLQRYLVSYSSCNTNRNGLRIVKDHESVCNLLAQDLLKNNSGVSRAPSADVVAHIHQNDRQFIGGGRMSNSFRKG